MKKVIVFKKFLGWLTASALSLTALAYLPELQVSAIETGERILIDINKNDGRKASQSKNANNWVVDNTYTYTINGITCKLSSGGNGSVDLVNNKILQLQDTEKTPTLTMDGAKIKDGSGNPSLKLEISGLSAGNHSIKTIHACADRNVTNSSLTVKINGKTVASGVKCPTSPTNAQDAGIAFGTFSGTSATVEIIAEGNGTLNTPWLNGFEIDGADPFQSISNFYPADQEKHALPENGLSWTAGKNAVSHNIYIGTDFSAVAKANEKSPEFKGNVKESKFSLDNSYSSVPVYYWRVDEINQDGSIVTGAVYSFQIARLAFPTAEGYGRYARGGRGGYVYHVTNLNDSGEGSLRYGLETLTGARTIVFDVGGIIELKSKLTIPEEGGNVYVAGQTAPGDGITLTQWGFGMIGCDDVIIRDIHVRPGDRNLTGVNEVSDGMGLSSSNHCIIDHCSISWATDEGFSSRSASNITFQWNIIAESLNNSIHYNANDRTQTECHAFAGSVSGYTGSFHHNLLVNNTGRNWSMAGGMEQDGKTYGGQLDISNNVVYNWRDRTTDGGVRRLNFVNNYYKAGAVSNTALHVVSIDGNELGTDDMQKMYVSGNVMTDSKGGYILKASDDAWAMGKAKSGQKNASDNDVRSNSPFFENYINLQSAEEAYHSVTDAVHGAGANAQGYDYLDSRYLKEVTTGTYTYTGSKDGLNGIIDSQKDVGGYPNSSNFKGGTASKDSDGDGMPDTWESEHGLNPNNASDGAIVSLSADDYTNLELYLNELAGDTVEFNGTVEKEPLNGTYFKNLVIQDTEHISGWQSAENLKIGSPVFGDRTVTFTELPEQLFGAEQILTACDSKNAVSDTVASFEAVQDITVYTAVDQRVEKMPEFLKDWTKTGISAKASNDVVFVIYQKNFSADETVTLGANGQSSGCVNYTVFLTEQNNKLKGDVNADNSVNISDILVMQKWLHGKGNLADWQAGDMNEDGKINIYDLILLKKILLH